MTGSMHGRVRWRLTLWYAITLTSAGRIVVDPAHKLEREQWDDPKSFIELK